MSACDDRGPDPRPFALLAVDVVVFAFVGNAVGDNAGEVDGVALTATPGDVHRDILGGALCVRLVRVREGPFAGDWACPGSLVAAEESLEEVAGRELNVARGGEQLGAYIEQLRTFGDIDRDPRGRVVSTAYLALLRDPTQLSDSSRYAGASWCPVDALPPLAYDHAAMIGVGLERVRAKLGYTNIVHALLPREWTFAELQSVYEAVLERSFDRRNFRKKLLATGLLEAVGRKRGGAHRPAELYRFREQRVVSVDLL